MGRKSSIEKLPPAVKAHIQRRLRENRLTLDEMIADLQAHFPTEPTPSRSALGRHRAGVAELIAHERDMAIAAEAMVAELGEDFDNKSGALLAQAVTTLANKAALGAIESGEASIKDVLDLARAAKSAQEARSLNLKERQAVAREARERLLEEQKAKLDELGQKSGVTEETKLAIRQVLGIV